MISKNACSGKQSISKNTILALTTPSILDNVSQDNWHVISFDPVDKVVCIDLVNRSNIIRLSFKLPTLN